MTLTNPPVCAVCGETKDASPRPWPGRHILDDCDLVLHNADRCGYYAPDWPVADGHHPFIEAHCACCGQTAAVATGYGLGPCLDQAAHRHHVGGQVFFFLAIEDRIKAALHPKFYCPKCGCMLGGEGAPCVPCDRQRIAHFVENFLSFPSFARATNFGLLTGLVVSDIGGREAPLGTAKPTEPDHECAGEDVDMLEDDESDDQTLQVDVPFAAERYATVIFPLDLTRAEANKIHDVLTVMTEVPA